MADEVVLYDVRDDVDGPDFKEGVASFLQKRPAAFPPLGEGSNTSIDI